MAIQPMASSQATWCISLAIIAILHANFANAQSMAPRTSPRATDDYTVHLALDSPPTPLPESRDDWIALIDARIQERESDNEDQAAASDGWDPSLVRRGQQAFNRDCTVCHDADRSLSKTKSYGEWLATVRRMAAKDGAEVAAADITAIATYLASLSQPEGPAGQDSGDQAAEDSAPVESVPSTTMNATISTLWRGTNDEQPLENPGFFLDAWFGAEWRPQGPLSAKVTACTSCHADQNPSSGFSVELVEASATMDIIAALRGCDTAHGDGGRNWDAEVQGGRFIVPFGAFSAMSHPGAYRTVTNPLMFNMGRRVAVGPLRPVLPAPYADEGVRLHGAVSCFGNVRATVDAFAVNGLQGNDPRIFNLSRSYRDNNREPAVGGRVTIGNRTLRAGGSILVGNYADEGFPAAPHKLVGGDITARYKDLWRFYFEYAIREETSTFVPNDHNYVYGIVVESEVNLWNCPDVSFITRYDTLEHRHALFGDDTTERFTYGLNVGLPGGSRLAVNHEHWMFVDDSDVDVIGLRWVATF